MNKKSRIALIIIVTIIMLPFIYIRMKIILRKWGVDDGCSGRYVTVSLNDLKIEKRFSFSDGELLFSNLEDELPPIMIRLNRKNEVVWAVKFEMDEECINMNSITELTYNEDYGRIEFFNKSFMEPGVIQLTFDHEINYVYTDYW